MGSHPMAVVDDALKVHGLDGLRVIDASVMPAATSTYTNAPTIMIAEKGRRPSRVPRERDRPRRKGEPSRRLFRSAADVSRWMQLCVNLHGSGRT